MREMKFIESTSAPVVQSAVNQALAQGFEYLETIVEATSTTSFILVIMKKD